MNRLVVRLVVSHILVAVLGALATFLVVRQLAPALFDENMRGSLGHGPMAGAGPGGMGAVRQQFGDAVDKALLIGALVGALAAAAFGIVSATRLVRPIDKLRMATRDLAAGNYTTDIPSPRERELAELAADIDRLGDNLAATETRRVQLLGELAHELRTPLTIIDGRVEGMIDGVLPATEDELGHISDEVRRLRRLADDLSALSRTAPARGSVLHELRVPDRRLFVPVRTSTS